MKDENSRNTIIFLVCALALFIAYQVFVMDPINKRQQAQARQAQAQQAELQKANPALRASGAPSVSAPPAVTRAAAVAASPRIKVETPSLSGSISLRGARIDDLYLQKYRVAVSKTSPPVELLAPEGSANAWFADFGWAGANVPGLPNAATVWTLAQGDVLAPGKPVTLTYANGQGLTFTRRLEVDDKFMFTVSDTVANTAAAPVTLAAYASVQRQGMPKPDPHSQIVHEGAIGALGVEKPTMTLIKFKKWAKDGGKGEASKGGWVGITDKYWLAALIPDQSESITGQFRNTKAGGMEVFDSNFVGPARQIAPGAQVTETTRFFAGAKTVPMLQSYEKALNIPRFDDAVDWGMFWFFTRPIFSFLSFIFHHVGNFGVAILVLTVVVRAIFFPLANKQYESMTKMKKVQPQMEELRKKYKDDPAKQQQELMALYQREKVNPLAGCLPILLQIPVFFALYKTLTVTIEMRHAPFFGYIKDLSARDPTTIWNLFGAIPWTPAHAPLIGGLLDGPLHLGVLPLAYGFTMWLTTAMSPPAPDPMQQRIFQLMPLLFMFIMAPFAVGLLIYWTWSNVLTIIQQYVIMRRFGVETPIDRAIAKFGGKKATS